jgi:hypothetical protein
MDDKADKAAHEAYRVRQFGGGHPAIAFHATRSPQPSPGASTAEVAADTERIILHFDGGCPAG